MQSRRLSRRTVLRGLGAAVALPLLDVMPAAASGFGAAASKPRGGFREPARLSVLPERHSPRRVVSRGDRTRGTAREAERVDESPGAVQGAPRHPHQRLDAQGQRPRGRAADVADRGRLRPPRRQRRRGVGRPGRGAAPARRDDAAVARAVGAGRGLLLELAAAQRHLVVGARTGRCRARSSRAPCSTACSARRRAGPPTARSWTRCSPTPAPSAAT